MTQLGENLTIKFGRQGWIEVTQHGPKIKIPMERYQARLEFVGDRLRIRELRLQGGPNRWQGGPITSRRLAGLHLGTVERIVNEPVNRDLALERWDWPGVNMERLAGNIGFSFGADTTLDDLLRAGGLPDELVDLVPEELREQKAFPHGFTDVYVRDDIPYPAYDADDPLSPHGGGMTKEYREYREEKEPVLDLTVEATPKRKPVRRPEGKNLPDEFFAEVAEAYRDAVGHGLAPAQVIAKEAGVKPATAYKWIRQARERGHLGAGVPGVAGEALQAEQVGETLRAFYERMDQQMAPFRELSEQMANSPLAQFSERMREQMEPYRRLGEQLAKQAAPHRDFLKSISKTSRMLGIEEGDVELVDEEDAEFEEDQDDAGR